MPIRTLALAILLAGCGSVKERGDCAVSADCPVGERCAHTPDGSVCWPDGVAPTVSSIVVAPDGGGSVRDGRLVVLADVADDEELLSVQATTDLDPARAFALTPLGGGEWTTTIPLSELPFPAFEREVIVTVSALDGARNAAEATAGAGQRPVVSRLRWSYASSGELTSPAVTVDGDVVFGRSDTVNQLVAVHPDGTQAWTRSLGSGSVTAPPSVGAQAIWVGANDGKLYAVKLDGSAELTSRSCTASGVAKGPPAILTTAGVDVAFGAFANGRIVASTAATCAQTPLRDPFSGGAAIGMSGDVFGATANAGASSIRAFSWDGAAFEELWSPAVGGTVAVTPAFDAEGRILTVGQDAGVDRTTSAGVSAPLATLSASIDDSPIVVANGDIVVGDAGGKLHRLAPDGTAVWGAAADLGAALHAPMALAGGGTHLLVATADGKVHALDGAGTVLWSGALTAGMALGAGAIRTPVDAPLAPDGAPISTAYFGGADGVLYAVIVDGQLDADAPWPKAWHDARNTSRAGGAF